MSSNVERPQTYLILFLGLLGLSCAFILSLPVFPSQDGPMHVYYVHILGSLISNSSSPYSKYFYIRSYFPPYSLYYYVLMFLMKIAPVALAERLIVCIIFTIQACGFRYLARVLGPFGYLATLWSLPLLLNWPLAMGFQNFSLSLALAMWAFGLWWRMRAKPTPKLLALFLVTVSFVAVAHPVPLLLVLAVTGFDLLLQFLQLTTNPSSRSETANVSGALERPTGGIPAGAALASLKLPISGFFASCLGVIYVLHFTDKRRVAQNAMDHAARISSWHRIIKLSTLGVFSGHDLGTYIYRCGLYALFLAAIALAMRAMRQHRVKPLAFTLGHPWLFLALAGVVVTLAAPSDMNGSHFFSDRLVIIPWLCALLAASVHPRVSRSREVVLACLASLAVVVVLVMANSRIRPIANEQAAARSAVFPEPRGAAGLLLGGTLTPAEDAMLQRVSFNAYAWQSAYKFDQSETILLNPPWLDLPILAISQRPGDLDKVYAPQVLDQPGNMLTLLSSEPPAARHEILARARFVLLSTRAEAASAGLTPSAGWNCVDRPPDLLCDRIR